MLKGIDMVVYQALKRIVGDAGVATVLDDSKYVEEQLQSKEWEREYQLKQKASHLDSANGNEPFYTFDKSDLENTVCMTTSPLSAIAYGSYDWDLGLLDASTISGYTEPFNREKVLWLNHRPNAQTSKELGVVFATVSCSR